MTAIAAPGLYAMDLLRHAESGGREGLTPIPAVRIIAGDGGKFIDISLNEFGEIEVVSGGTGKHMLWIQPRAGNAARLSVG